MKKGKRKTVGLHHPEARLDAAVVQSMCGKAGREVSRSRRGPLEGPAPVAGPAAMVHRCSKSSEITCIVLYIRCG